MTTTRNRFVLNGDAVRDLVDAQHLTQGEVAEKLGISRIAWSRVLNGHQAVSPRVRRALVAAFPGQEARLWTVEKRAPTAALP
jgi:transcriptional regulator with XRE-family HTH domain